VHGKLRSAHPIVSPRIWTTIATGKRPAKHGILHWVQVDEEGGYKLLLGSDRKGPAIWNIASAEGLTTGVVNWLDSYPPEKIRGIVVSDFAIAGTRAGREKLFAGNQEPKGRVGDAVIHPTEWASEFERLSEEPPLLPMRNPFEGDDAMPSWINRTIPAQSFRDDDLVARTALAIEEQIHPDLLMVYLSGIDKVSHNLWGALEPADAYPDHIKFTPQERAATVAALEQYYEYTDQLIGKLVERFSGDDLVMVVSDHGFEAQMLVVWVTGGHHSDAAVDGVLFARGRNIPAAKRLPFTRIADITPTILTWYGMAPGSSMDGRSAKFLDLLPTPPTAGYDELPIERVGDESRGAEDAIMEQLRGLGYVE
jgi:predicted AlkP superfamily phosphohydrolase/phosphomutase